ncbi:minor tail protein [Mycobacterium phage Damien]|uniref:minor tail protein n=1 Tax=Mycobacterium phage Damien TaxID=1486469 RepID=UPI00045F74D5|nr:minor tail protein [Mycobacterium phage Damien]AHZ95390.1 minor tail protein [Mycobacterium phage Damien]AXH47154.1 minor tail protein [Mycobacterium phage Cborch11]
MAQSGYGSYQYESPESRALGSITAESYDKDQAKNLIKLNNDVSYMAAYMRKMQKGIDEANQNFIQQIQSFINDVVVLLGGGTAQGFDFGDLKYILQMVGALLGLGDANFPLSSFEAVWHMLSTYIFPTAQFADVINALIDSVIAGALDLLGEVPIVGEAVEQFAMYISLIRDWIGGLDEAFGGLINLLGGIFGGVDFNDLPSPQQVWQGVFNTFLKPLLNFLEGLINPLTGMIFPWKLPPISFGQITSDKTNFLPLGSFPEGSIPDDPDWLLNLLYPRTQDGTGAAEVVCDGTRKALRSGESPTDIVPVTKGQQFTVECYVAYEDFVGTGEPIRLEVVPFIGDERQNIILIDKYEPTTPTLDWPGHRMGGEYTVPEGVTGIQTRIYITEDALEGTLWFDDVTFGSSGKFHIDWVDGLPEELQSIFSRWQLTIDTIVNSIRNTNIFGFELSDIAEALKSIPALNILGVLGPGSIAETIERMINQIVGGFVGTPGTGASLTDLFNFAKQISSWASQGRFAWELLGKRDNTPVDTGLLPSSTSNYKINYINTTLPCTQSESRIAAFRIEESAPLGVISWLGYGSSGITAFYVNIWKINKNTDVRHLVHHSGDVKSILHPGTTDADIGWNFYFLPEGFPRYAEDELFYELVPVGGTHYVRGIDTADKIPDHPYASTKGLGATRNNTDPENPPETISRSAWTTSSKIPWIETAIDVVNGNNQYDPVIVPFDDDGSVPVPSWANYVDLIAVGRGGRGANGATLNFNGRPGTPGKISATTLIRETHFTGDATLNFVTDSDGAKFTLGANELIAQNGENGSGQVFNGSMTGRGPTPRPFVYREEIYDMGEDQKVAGGRGANPGGAGAGGRGLILPESGGAGGSAAGWVKFRQSPVEDEGDIFDTIAPSAPDITVLSRSYSSIEIEVDSPEADVAGYDFYLDGVKINDLLVPEEDE